MPKKILVLDDNPDTLNFIKEVLSYEKFETKIISNCENVIECIQSFRPDLIILDYRKKGINGDSVCNQIKANPSLNYLPVIICSAYLNKNLSTVKLACGCDDVLVKPFGLNELIDKVNNLILG